MASLMRNVVFIAIGAFTIASVWPTSAEAASAFFFQSPVNYNRSYYYQQGPIMPYAQQRPYGYGYGYGYRPQIYQDPRSDARYMSSQTPNVGPDYYQQYNNWWQK